MNKKLIKGFTLAETLIVIAVLGIVAMLTVPNVIRQHMEAVARTKIKKSMTVYDLAITKMTVENDLRSNTELEQWADNAEKNDCANTSAYFKAKSCKFKTADGVWWYIDKIMNPIIALSEKDLDDAIEAGGTINGKTSFKLVASFDRQSGAFRVDDLGYEKLKLAAQLALSQEEQPEDVEENIEDLETLFNFVNNKKDDESSGSSQSPFDKCKANNSPTCTVNGVEYTLTHFDSTTVTEYAWGEHICKWDSKTNTQNCNYESTVEGGDYYIANVGYPEDYDTQAHDCTGSTYEYCSGNEDYYNAAKRHC